MSTDHGIALPPRTGTADATSHAYDALHTIHPFDPSGTDFWYELGYPLAVGVAFRLFHEQPRHGYPAAGSEVPWRLVRLGQANQASRAHNLFVVPWVLVLFGELGKLGLELSDLFLQPDDIVSADLFALGGIIVFARRAGALTGETPREVGIASRFPLDDATG